jgi:hypothetical protein
MITAFCFAYVAIALFFFANSFKELEQKKDSLSLQKAACGSAIWPIAVVAVLVIDE